MDDESAQLNQQLQAALDQIDRLLRQMYLLAELSAGDNGVDRARLQAVLDRLRKKIDRIADDIEKMTSQ